MSDWVDHVRVATTGNLAALSGLLTIDGVTVVASDRVLVKDQTTAKDNGLYAAAAGAWSRTADTLAPEIVVRVSEGTAHAHTEWFLGTQGTIIAGTTALSFVAFSGIQPSPVALVSTSNLTLSGEQTIDGTLTSASRVLLTGQSTPSQNGLWLTSSGAWTRPRDFSVDDQVILGAVIFVTGGTLGAGTRWQVSTGTTIAGAKAYAKLMSAADKIEHDRVIASTYYASPPSGDTAGATDTPLLQAICAKLIAHPGSSLQLAVGTYYVNDELVIDQAIGCEIRGAGGGGTWTGNQLVRVGTTATTRLAAGFAQPAVNATVVAAVDSSTGFVPNRLVTVGTNWYRVIATGAGTLTLKNIGTPGNTIAGGTVASGGRVLADDAIIQARGACGCQVRNVTLVGLSPGFTGKGVNFDGIPFGSDGGFNQVRNCTIRTENFAAVTPTLAAEGTSPPAATLTGTVNGTPIHLWIRFTDATHYQYSTDGGFTWEETGIDCTANAGVHKLLGSAAGLTFTCPAGTYHADNAYHAAVGLGAGVVVNSGFNCTIADVDVAFVQNGSYLVGATNFVRNIGGLAVGGYLVLANQCFGLDAAASGEPGPAGRGGIFAINCNGCKLRFVSGDALQVGPWVSLVNGWGNEVSGAYSINAGTVLTTLAANFTQPAVGSTLQIQVGATGQMGTSIGRRLVVGTQIYKLMSVDDATHITILNQGAAGNSAGGTSIMIPLNVAFDVGDQAAAIMATGGGNLSIEGDYEFCKTVLNAPGPSTLNGVKVGAIGFLGTRATSLAGAFISVYDYYVPGGIYLTSPTLGGVGYAPIGIRTPAVGLAISSAVSNDDLAVNGTVIDLSGPSAAATITGFGFANVGDGFEIELTWAFTYPLTFAHDRTSATTRRILTETGADVTIPALTAGGVGHARLRYDASFNRWLLKGHSPTTQVGVATLTAGVSGTIGAVITATSRIFVTQKTPAGTSLTTEYAALSGDRSVGTPGSFKVTALLAAGTANTADTSTLDWQVVN